MRTDSVDRVAARSPEERVYEPQPRWGRRVLIAAILIVLLLGGGFYGWTVNGRRGLEGQVAAYRAAGEPIELADFVVRNVADADNAAIPLREAAATIDVKSDAWKTYQAFPDDFALPLTDKELAAIRDAATAAAGAFGKVDEAMPRTGVDWQIRYTSPVIQILLPDLNSQRQLARLMVDRARLNYQQGDHAAAIRDLQRAACIGRAVAHHPMIVSHLVSVGINALSVSALQEMAPGLKIGDAAGEVRAAEVSQLIAALLDDTPLRDSYRRGMYGERAGQLDTARCIADGRLSIAQVTGPGVGPTGPNPIAALATFAAKPIALGDGLIMITHTTALLRAGESSPNWPAYQAAAPPYPPEVANSRVRHMVARTLLPSFERLTLVNFRNTAERRMTAIALAARLYAADHAGQPPAKLEDLVPKYLPALPLDPFAAAPQPLKYVNDPDKPIVYSIGEDGIDGGGSELPARKNVANVERWQKLDAVVHLKLQPRQRPKEEEIAEEDPEIYPAEKEIRAAAATRAAVAPTTARATTPATTTAP